MIDNNSVEAVQKIIGEPFSPGLPENALKVRRNLLAFSLIALYLAHGNIQIAGTFTVLGLTFGNITPDKIQFALTIVLAYHLVHFFWYVGEEFMAWNLRVTGCKAVFGSKMRLVGSHEDLPEDPRQSTLYSWWLFRAERYLVSEDKWQELREKLNSIEERVKAWPVQSEEDEKFRQKLTLDIRNNQDAIRTCMGTLADFAHVFKDNRIPVSLEKFDRFFAIALRVSNWRWILIEISFPLVAGVAGIFSLATR